MILSPVSSLSSAASLAQAQQKPAASQSSSSDSVQDTVTLSSTAQNAGIDVDHDGDSH